MYVRCIMCPKNVLKCCKFLVLKKIFVLCPGLCLLVGPVVGHKNNVVQQIFQ